MQAVNSILGRGDAPGREHAQTTLNHAASNCNCGARCGSGAAVLEHVLREAHLSPGALAVASL